MVVAEALGFVGGALGTMQAWPQVRRVRTLGHGRGVSRTAWLLSLSANGIWLGYGIRIASPSLIATLVEARVRPWLSLPLVAVGLAALAQVLPEAVLSVALVGLTMSRLPQVRTSWTHYRAGLPSAVSMTTVLLGIAGLVCWEAYSLLMDRPLLVLTTTLALSLAIAIAVLERAGERTDVAEPVLVH